MSVEEVEVLDLRLHTSKLPVVFCLSTDSLVPFYCVAFLQVMSQVDEFIVLSSSGCLIESAVLRLDGIRVLLKLCKTLGQEPTRARGLPSQTSRGRRVHGVSADLCPRRPIRIVHLPSSFWPSK